MRSWRLVACLLVLLMLSSVAKGPAFAAPGEQEAAPLSLDDYWKLVQETEAALARVASQPGSQSTAVISRLVNQWKLVKEVRLEDESILPVDSSYLVSVLESGEVRPAHKLVLALLEAHRKYPADLFTAQDVTGLEAILARPEFQWPEPKPNPIGEWLQKMLDRLFEWLNKLFGNRNSNGEPGEITVGGSSILSYLMAAVLTAVIVYVLWGLFNDLAVESQLEGEGEFGDEMLTSETAFSRAQSLSRGGNFRSAVRYLYLSSLLMLDERGLLRYDRSKTNHEYLKSVENAPELADPLKDVIDVFDNVWYGYHSLDEQSFKHYSERVEVLKEEKKKQP